MHELPFIILARRGDDDGNQEREQEQEEEQAGEAEEAGVGRAW